MAAFAKTYQEVIERQQLFTLWQYVRNEIGNLFQITDIRDDGRGRKSYMIESVDGAEPWTYAGAEDIEPAEQLPPAEEIELEESKQVGETVEYRGHVYQVTSSYFLTAQQSAEIDDIYAGAPRVGWHTRAKLVR